MDAECRARHQRLDDRGDPPALGAIADFCDAAGVDQIRIIQCDTTVTSDETVSSEELTTFAVSGFGGSDLSPAMLMLAEDPQVTATVVVTDGEIAFPADPMPYGVLWVLPVRVMRQVSIRLRGT